MESIRFKASSIVSIVASILTIIIIFCDLIWTIGWIYYLLIVPILLHVIDIILILRHK